MGEVAVLNQAQANSGIVDIAGGAGEMKARLDEMKGKLTLVKDFFQSIMEKDLDYGVIPGTDKPTLYKPGAEKLNELYGFAPVVKEKKETRDVATGYYHAELVIQIVHRNTGAIIAEGVGEASSFESKYRYRWVYESDIPKGVDKATLVSKTFESKKTGKEYTRYRLENPDLIDQWNTVLKMAKKRALVDATLSATRTSGIFSQSEDEMDAWIEGETNEKEKLEKKRTGPQPGDEKADFNPFAVDGGGTGGDKPARAAGDISEAQEGKIIGDAKRKGLNAEGIKALVVYTKKKPLNKLTKAEASAVIEFIGKTEAADLQALAAKAAEAAPQWTAEELGDK